MADSDYSIKNVAVVDDDQREAKIMVEVLRDAGYSPSIFSPNGHGVDEFAEAIKGQYDGAICDHRLQRSPLFHFDGASLVAELTNHQVPAILITQFLSMDFDVSIRKWRHLIPVLLERDDADDHSRLTESFEYCVREILGDPASTRRSHRCLVRVIELSQEAGEDVIDAYVPSWNPHQAVRFPKSLLGSLAEQATPGARFFAQVNVGALNPGDLFFRDFEAAPQPSSDDAP